MSKVEHAKLIAQAVHFGQTDNGGKPRYDHVLHVGMQFQDENHQVVGILHDTIEDSVWVDWRMLYNLFDSLIANAVVAVTRLPGELYFKYIERCKLNYIARAVKIADIKHNMDRSRWPEMPDSYYEREIKALKILEGHPNE